MKLFGKIISKKILFGIITGVIVIGGATTGIVLMNNNKNKEETPKDTIILKDNLKYEINSELTLLSLISKDNKLEIISEDETIDTSILGKKELVIKYKDKEEKEYKFSIEIVDTTKPTIEYKKELSTTSGTKIDLLKDVKVSDNSNEEIKATIEGEYDFNKVGTYNLKYVAIDSSNNKAEEDFTLKVNEKPKATNNNSSNNNGNNNSNNTSQQPSNCETEAQYNAKFEKYQSLYWGKVYTSIPDNNKDLSWSSARFYWKQISEGEYQLKNERISGHSIGQEASSSIMSIVGSDPTTSPYKEGNPIVLYEWDGLSYTYNPSVCR